MSVSRKWYKIQETIETRIDLFSRVNKVDVKQNFDIQIIVLFYLKLLFFYLKLLFSYIQSLDFKFCNSHF